jgi:hypothetical protein
MTLPYGSGVRDCETLPAQPLKSSGPGKQAFSKVLPLLGSSSSSSSSSQWQASMCQVVVVQRPGMREFLQQAAAFADLVLFTAGVPE